MLRPFWPVGFYKRSNSRDPSPIPRQKRLILTATATPLTLFAVQLVLNVAWSWIFFGMHQPGWAFVEIVMLWLAIVATMVAFFRCSKIAGWLLVPYLAWVSFAGVLNFAIWRLNLT